jgi:hypothetical protein
MIVGPVKMKRDSSPIDCRWRTARRRIFDQYNEAKRSDFRADRAQIRPLLPKDPAE